MMRKREVLLTVVANMFRVKEVVNSTRIIPGDMLDRDQVEDLIRMTFKVRIVE